MKKSTAWIVFILLAALGVVAAVLAFAPQPVLVEVGTVDDAPMRVFVEEEGKTRIRERYVVSSPLTGRLRRITLDPGDPVIANQTVLAVLEPSDPALLDARALAEARARVRSAEASVRQAGAALERARAAYDFAENDLTRVREAHGSGAANESELDAAQMAFRTAAEDFRAGRFGEEIAQYEVEVARSALLFAEGEDGAERARMPIFSPIDGVVLRVLQESVAVVSPGSPLIEVGDARDLEIVSEVLSTDAVKIRPGQRVIVDHWGGDKPLEAVVRLVEPSAFTKISALGIEEQRVNVIADFVSPPEQRTWLGDRYRVDVRVVVWSGDRVLQIPLSAGFRSAGEWVVFVVVDGRVELRSFDAGRMGDQTIQVLSGLIQNETIVLHPSDKVRDGVRVKLR